MEISNKSYEYNMYMDQLSRFVYTFGNSEVTKVFEYHHNITDERLMVTHLEKVLDTMLENLDSSYDKESIQKGLDNKDYIYSLLDDYNVDNELTSDGKLYMLREKIQHVANMKYYKENNKNISLSDDVEKVDVGYGRELFAKSQEFVSRQTKRIGCYIKEKSAIIASGWKSIKAKFSFSEREQRLRAEFEEKINKLESNIELLSSENTKLNDDLNNERQASLDNVEYLKKQIESISSQVESITEPEIEVEPEPVDQKFRVKNAAFEFNYTKKANGTFTRVMTNKGKQFGSERSISEEEFNKGIKDYLSPLIESISDIDISNPSSPSVIGKPIFNHGSVMFSQNGRFLRGFETNNGEIWGGSPMNQKQVQDFMIDYLSSGNELISNYLYENGVWDVIQSVNNERIKEAMELEANKSVEMNHSERSGFNNRKSNNNRPVKEDGVHYRKLGDGTYARCEYKNGELGKMSLLTEEEYQKEVNKNKSVDAETNLNNPDVIQEVGDNKIETGDSGKKRYIKAFGTVSVEALIEVDGTYVIKTVDKAQQYVKRKTVDKESYEKFVKECEEMEEEIGKDNIVNKGRDYEM